jgi:hypothetical protein
MSTDDLYCLGLSTLSTIIVVIAVFLGSPLLFTLLIAVLVLQSALVRVLVTQLLMSLVEAGVFLVRSLVLSNFSAWVLPVSRIFSFIQGELLHTHLTQTYGILCL